LIVDKNLFVFDINGSSLRSISSSFTEQFNCCNGIAFKTPVLDKENMSRRKEKLPAAGTAQYFTIVRIAHNNVKEDLMYKNAKVTS
jgi:hypothetical protein